MDIKHDLVALQDSSPNLIIEVFDKALGKLGYVVIDRLVRGTSAGGVRFKWGTSPDELASFCLETSRPGSHARLPAAWEPPLLDFPDKN